MKKSTKIILSTIFLILLGMFVFMDIMEDFEERFRIEGVDFSLFKVTGQQTSFTCYVIKDSVVSFDSAFSGNYLIGIRFKPEFISLKREHLWDNNRMPLGAKGHEDSITEFRIQGISDKKVSDSCFLNAHKFKYFYKENFQSGQRHHGSTSACLVAQTYASIPDFLKMYNRNSDTVNFNINDYFLFRVPDSLVNRLINEKAQLTLKFSDGRSVQGYIK